MKKSSLRAALLLAVAVVFTAPAASAQVETAPPIKQKAPKPKVEKFKGVVMAATTHQIIVHSIENEKLVRTFTYNPKVKDYMLGIIDRGGYQAGDRVEIHHEPESDVAIKIKGKPSKPL